MFALVTLEHGMHEDVIDSPQRGRHSVLETVVGIELGDRCTDAERGPHRFDRGPGRGLVEGKTDRGGVDKAEVEAARPSRGARPLRIGMGACVVSQMVNSSAFASQCATTARFSIAADAPRSYRNRRAITTSAFARAAS